MLAEKEADDIRFVEFGTDASGDALSWQNGAVRPINQEPFFAEYRECALYGVLVFRVQMAVAVKQACGVLRHYLVVSRLGGGPAAGLGQSSCRLFKVL